MDGEHIKAALAHLAADAATEADLRALSEAAREGRLRLIQRKGGRPSIDDREALNEMQGHVDDGASVKHAASLVARVWPGHSVEAVAGRLDRKFRAAQKAASKPVKFLSED